ncbi:hypothetical protein Bbelb_097820 [Branchiostoma belcheri]|nr:hypothetical protein Bbelb_097820 [Branchiostoma belcheri]
MAELNPSERTRQTITPGHPTPDGTSNRSVQPCGYVYRQITRQIALVPFLHQTHRQVSAVDPLLTAYLMTQRSAKPGKTAWSEGGRRERLRSMRGTSLVVLAAEIWTPAGPTRDQTLC